MTHFERGVSKKLKEVNSIFFFFFLHLVSFYGQDHEKQEGPGSS